MYNINIQYALAKSWVTQRHRSMYSLSHAYLSYSCQVLGITFATSLLDHDASGEWTAFIVRATYN